MKNRSDNDKFWNVRCINMEKKCIVEQFQIKRQRQLTLAWTDIFVGVMHLPHLYIADAHNFNFYIV